MKSGIYQIINVINGKKYIGQSVNVEERMNEHLRELIKGTHGNRHLQSSFNKYGQEAFAFSILERCSVEKLSEREIFWIAQTQSYIHGYNMTKGGEGTRGFSPSIETRAKYSANSKRRWNEPDERLKLMRKLKKAIEAERVPVIQVETGIIFPSVTKAGESIGHQSSEISGACMGKTHVCGDYHWRFFTQEIAETLDTPAYDEWRLNIINNGQKQAVICIETNIVYPSISDASKQTGVHYSSISKCCLFKAKSANNLHWRYANMSQAEWEANFNKSFNQGNCKQTSVICLETGEIFSSIKAAARFANVSKTAISNACRGVTSKAGNYHWRYEYTTNEQYKVLQNNLKHNRELWNKRKKEILKSKERRLLSSEKTKERWNSKIERERMISGLNKAVEARKRKVLQVETGAVFDSITAAAEAVGLTQSSGIISCCAGKRKTAGGYHWKYTE